jgi:hypothetical protein
MKLLLLGAVFPFFTFAPSSGWLGPELPHVLFFARIFAGEGSSVLLLTAP